MSTNLVPADNWPANISQADIPANNNARRFNVSQVPIISGSTTAQPSLISPADDGKAYIIPEGATGLTWAAFTPGNIAIFYGGTFTEFVPPQGMRKYVSDVDENWQFKPDSSGQWVVESAGGGGTIIGITAGDGIDVDSSIPTNPVVSLDSSSSASLALADSATQPGDSATTLAMSTARLLGRTTASSGPVEEISVGSGLSLSAGTLSATGGGGSVTSVDVSGGTTGLSFSGGPVTGSGTITLSGTLAMANGGTGAALTDPNADRILFWDDSASAMAFLTPGTNLTITGTTLDATGGSGSPGGSNTQVQFNDSSAFGGDAGLVYDKATDTLTGVNCVLTGLLNESRATAIARAATTSIGAATGNFVHLTGTTTITSFGTGTAGNRRLVTFDGAGTLTHNGTSLILPGAANITTAAGDSCLVVSEGSSNWRVLIYQRASGQALVSGAVTGWTNSLNVASPNNTVNASRWLASGGTTNQDAVVQPKGTGALQARLADSTATGGNKRGLQAVDWQLLATANTEVASGDNSTISGGQGNTADGANSTVIGGNGNRSGGSGAISGGVTTLATGNNALALVSNSTASATASVAVGDSCTASADYAIAIGRSTNADAPYSLAYGRYAQTRLRVGVRAFSNHFMASAGDAQNLEFSVAAATTNATPTALSNDDTAAGSANQVILADNSAMLVKGFIIARSSTNTKSWEVRATVTRGSGVGTTAIIGSAVVTVADATAGASGWTIGLSADTTNGALAITATGAAATNIKWSGCILAAEVVG